MCARLSTGTKARSSRSKSCIAMNTGFGTVFGGAAKVHPFSLSAKPMRKRRWQNCCAKLDNEAKKGNCSITLSFRTGTNAEDFCSDPTGISSSPQTGWTVKQQGGRFTFSPDTKKDGQVGGDGLVFTLSGIKVNQQPGTFVITIAEEASDPHASPPAPNQTRSFSPPLTKFPAQFGVGDLNADPPMFSFRDQSD
jgi:hypothetical protein